MTLTDDYIERRRTYVAEIRNSFDTDEAEESSGREKESRESSFLFAKIQLLTAIFLFCIFLFLKLTGNSIGGYAAEDWVDLITENYYDITLPESGIVK